MAQQFIIQLDDNGNLGINGPLHDPIMCYGLLEVARQAVEAHSKKDKPLVQPIHAILPPS